jgi:carnitine O-palmitoyltransferase 2
VLNKIILSTSTLSSEALDAGGFGPVNDQCYGIGYGMTNEGAGFGVSSFGRDSQAFLDHLEDALKEMVQVTKDTQK